MKSSSSKPCSKKNKFIPSIVTYFCQVFDAVNCACLAIASLTTEIKMIEILEESQKIPLLTATCRGIGCCKSCFTFCYGLNYELSLISSRKMGNEMWYLMAKKRMQQMAKKVAIEVSPTLTSSLKSSQ